MGTKEKATERERAQRHTIIFGHDGMMRIFVFASPTKKNRTQGRGRERASERKREGRWQRTAEVISSSSSNL